MNPTRRGTAAVGRDSKRTVFARAVVAPRRSRAGPRQPLRGLPIASINTQPKRETMSEHSEELERHTEEQILVRQVTHLQASWTEHERGQPGAFTFQLILDQGADEYVLRPSADDAEVLLRLFEISTGATFDRARRLLMFSDLSISS
jgi:hypothetical protein